MPVGHINVGNCSFAGSTTYPRSTMRRHIMHTRLAHSLHCVCHLGPCVQARVLKQYGELPEHIRINDTDVIFEGEDKENQEFFDFDDVSDR